MEQALIIFSNTHNVFSAEEVLKEQSYEFEIVSTPDDEENCCGLSIKINSNYEEEITQLLQEEFIQYLKVRVLN